MKPDKDFIRLRFSKALHHYHRMAQVQQGVAAELATIYKQHFNEFDPLRILEVGAGTGFLTRFLRFYHPGAEFFLNDLTDASKPYLGELMADYNAHYIWADAQNMELPSNLDAVMSASTIQWFDDLEGFLTRTAEATVPGGALALSTFGPENFREIRTIWGDGLDYATKNELGKMIESSGYEILHLSEQTRTLYFDIPLDVVYHIKYTGVNAVAPVHWTRKKLEDFNDRYRRLFLTRDGLLPLTYHPIFVVARKK